MGSKRLTKQKKMIWDTLMLLDHPTAAEVYEKIRKEYPHISLGTVYRNLSQMTEDGDVLRLGFLGEADRFDLNGEEHFHVACIRCGSIFDTNHTFTPELISAVDQAVEASTGIKVEHRTMLFSGVCRSCGITDKV